MVWEFCMFFEQEVGFLASRAPYNIDFFYDSMVELLYAIKLLHACFFGRGQGSWVFILVISELGFTNLPGTAVTISSHRLLMPQCDYTVVLWFEEGFRWRLMTSSGSTSKRGYSKALSIGLKSSTDITEYLNMDVNGSSVREKPRALENPVFWDSLWFGNAIIRNLMYQTIIMNIVDFLAKCVKF